MATFKGAAKEAQRAMLLMKQREKERQELEMQKRKLAAELRVGEIANKFTTVHYDAIEQQLKSDTVGLVTLDEMKARQQAFMSQHEKELAMGSDGKHGKLLGQAGADRKAKLQKRLLSFGDDEEEDEDGDDSNSNAPQSTTDRQSPSLNEAPPLADQKQEPPDSNDVKQLDDRVESIDGEEKCHVQESDASQPDATNQVAVPSKRRRLGKNPLVDTSFLPDIDRDEQDERLREELRQEWVARQTAIKEEEISITYSYWDGSGHRRQTRMRKGQSIYQFLHRCLEQMRKDFSELKSATADQMMFVKEDLIIPHHYTFYDFIVTKARGKSGPLFHFDVHDDIRIRQDAKVEKDESHAGKVCLRSWYERNKHIFPASRWEPYDPAKNWDQYTVSDKMAAKITVK